MLRIRFGQVVPSVASFLGPNTRRLPSEAPCAPDQDRRLQHREGGLTSSYSKRAPVAKMRQRGAHRVTFTLVNANHARIFRNEKCASHQSTRARARTCSGQRLHLECSCFRKDPDVTECMLQSVCRTTSFHMYRAHQQGHVSAPWVYYSQQPDGCHERTARAIQECNRDVAKTVSSHSPATCFRSKSPRGCLESSSRQSVQALWPTAPSPLGRSRCLQNRACLGTSEPTKGLRVRDIVSSGWLAACTYHLPYGIGRRVSVWEVQSVRGPPEREEWSRGSYSTVYLQPSFEHGIKPHFREHTATTSGWCV